MHVNIKKCTTANKSGVTSYPIKFKVNEGVVLVYGWVSVLIHAGGMLQIFIATRYIKDELEMAI